VASTWKTDYEMLVTVEIRLAIVFSHSPDTPANLLQTIGIVAYSSTSDMAMVLLAFSAASLP
jgi:hypothetical protein